MPRTVVCKRFAALALSSTALAALAIPHGAMAQETPAPDEPPAGTESEVVGNVIVVTAAPRRGEVIGDIPPETELDAADVASYGASSVEDLLTAISPQTGSARGRGSGGRPIILLNGQRISGFRELRDLPPEAIERVQVFPEELALRYGYRPDQRVVNFILRENFASFVGEVEHGRSTQGGYNASELEATLTRIGQNGRLNIDVEYEPGSALFESERGIVQSRLDEPGFVDNGEFRTLIGETDTFEVNANYNRRFGDTMSATLSGEVSRTDTTLRLGLPGTSLTIPASSPFARIGANETIFRLLPAVGGTLDRFSDTLDAEAGLSVNGQIDDWRWSLTGNYSSSESDTATDRSDLSTLVTRIAAGDPSLDPFARDLGLGLGFTVDRSHSVSQNADANATIAGSPLAMPAGPVTISATSGFEWRAIDSEAERSGVISVADLSRERLFARANVDIPIASRSNLVLGFLGDLSINGNIGYADLSDFGGLVEYGYGLNWEPLDGLSILASVIGEEAAPSVQQLGDPVIVTPNVSVFDFTTGQSVLIDRTTGGNPNLAAEERRDFKLGVNYRFGDNPEVRLSGEYVRNRSENVTASFPLLTPEIEAAFPDRVTRDAFGNLLAVDARPVTFSEVRSERIRYGINLSGRIGSDDDEEEGGWRGRRGGGGEGRGRRGRGQGASDAPSSDGTPASDGTPSPDGEAQPEGAAPQGEQANRGEGTPRSEGRRGGGRGPMGFMRGGRGGGGGGRWQLSLYHTYRLDETVLIRPGIPELDLLDGSVTSGSSPTARHSVELEGGMFLGGIGFRLSGEYSGAARIDGSGLPGSSDLFFDDIVTFNLRAFFNFGSRPGIVEDMPFLAGSRLALRVDNIFGGVQRITDQNGDVPLAYQPGFVDPRGRYVELSFRKRF